MTHTIRETVQHADETRNDDATPERDPHGLKGYDMVAENMPSVLRRLRPMEFSSSGMLRYLMGKRS